MEKAIGEFYRGEKTQGLVMLAFALLCLLLGWLLFVKWEGEVYSGAAVPCIAFSLLHFVLGAGGAMASHRNRPLTQWNHNPVTWTTDEQARLHHQKNLLTKYRTASSATFLLGGMFTIAGAFFHLGDYMLGSGVALCLLSGITLSFLLVAAFRLDFFLHELNVYERDRRE